MLWGKKAQVFSMFINTERHYILQTSHPSPFSANNGFLGCKHFTTANRFIESANGPDFKIKW